MSLGVLHEPLVHAVHRLVVRSPEMRLRPVGLQPLLEQVLVVRVAAAAEPNVGHLRVSAAGRGLTHHCATVAGVEEDRREAVELLGVEQDLHRPVDRPPVLAIARDEAEVAELELKCADLGDARPVIVCGLEPRGMLDALSRS